MTISRFMAASLAVAGLMAACCAKTPARAPEGPVTEAHPEVLFLGPIHRNAILYDLIYSYLVENGVYVEVDKKGSLPDKLPADLTGYKVVVADRDLPVMQEAATQTRLEEFEKNGGHVIYHKRPETINWNTNDQELYDVYDAVTKKFGARTQHPAFLERNASRSDKDVILTCAERMVADTEMKNWYIIGNDVAYMHFEGLLKTADLYGREDFPRYVQGMMAAILEKKGPKAPIFYGHLLLQFRQPGFEPYLEKTLENLAAPAAPRKAANGASGNPFVRCENLAETGSIMYAALYNKPEKFQIAVDRMKAGHEALFDPETKLWAHGGQAGGTRTAPWGRGDGWMLQGLTALIEYLPKDHPDYPTMVRYMEETADGLRRCQDPQTGLWHNLVDDPTTRLEASGTAMIVRAYCHAWRAGVCRTPEVKEMLTKAWRGIKAHTVGPRTYSFLWGMGTSNDRKAYAAKPSSGTAYIAPLAGPEYVKTFGPLVK